MNTAILLVSILTLHNGELVTDSFKTDPIPAFKCHMMKADLTKSLDDMNKEEIAGYSIECK